MWELWRVEISLLPLERYIACTTSCCYRTSRDVFTDQAAHGPRLEIDSVRLTRLGQSGHGHGLAASAARYPSAFHVEHQTQTKTKCVLVCVCVI